MSSSQSNTPSNFEILSHWAAADKERLDTTNPDDVFGWAAYKIKAQEGQIDILHENCERHQIELMELQTVLQNNEAIITELKEDNKKTEEQLKESQTIASYLQSRIIELEGHLNRVDSILGKQSTQSKHK